MRTIQKTLYRFDELNDDAKERARGWYREGEYPFPYDNADSLQAFCQHFGVSILHGRSGSSAAYCDEEIAELSGIRLWKYLNNSGLLDDNLLSGGYPFTGYHMDEALLDPIREFMTKPDSSITYHGLMQECILAYETAVDKDVQFYFSDESVEEFYLINGHEFDEHGNHA